MLRLTIASTLHDRTAALRDGRVLPEGIELNYLVLKAEEIFWRMLRHGEFDGSEMSLGGYLVRRGRGIDDLVALPVFLSRFFRHSSVYVNAAAGIQQPSDLHGRRVGIPEYQMTAGVWIRGILKDEYGFRAEECDWLQGGLEDPGRYPFEPVNPDGIRLSFAPDDRSLSRMLAEGEIDALLSPRTPSTFGDGQGRVKRLFPQFWVQERAYFARTGIFPIMHTFVVKRAILDANPWVAQTLVKAFTEAKRLAVADLDNLSVMPVTLPFLHRHFLETVDLMGPDYWPYGIEPNRTTLQTFFDYMVDQRLVPDSLRIEDMFAVSTQATSRV